MSMVTASELRIVLAEEQAAQVEAAAAEAAERLHTPSSPERHRGDERTWRLGGGVNDKQASKQASKQRQRLQSQV